MDIKVKHIIMLSKVVSKMGIKFNLTGKSQEEVGSEIIFGLVENIHKAETEFYDLLGDLANIKDVGEASIKDITETLKLVFKEIVGFFVKPAA